MEKQLGWTTLEQSKKLIEAELDPNTADMFYTSLDMHKKPWIWNSKPFLYPTDVPCWSLGRLIELMPKSLQIEGNPSFEIEGHSNEVHYIYYEEAYGAFFPHVIHKECKTTIFESIYSMIIWLLENNYIKKGKTK